MAKIKVDHSKFSGAAQAVDDYVDLLREQMGKTEQEVERLSDVWQGTDYQKFKARWGKVDNKKSTYYELVKSLEAYSKFLRYAGGKYKEAQVKAINRANNLPRW